MIQPPTTGPSVGASTARILFYWLSSTRLKSKDPAQFNLMGKPSPLHDDSKASSWMLLEYMTRCRFLFQGDIKLAIYGTLWYLSAVLTIGAFIWEIAR